MLGVLNFRSGVVLNPWALIGKLVLACALALAGQAALAAVSQAVLEQADALMKAGKADEAYRLLEPLEIEGAGDEVYDYLLATAALESGRPSKATFIYERILAVKPAFVGVRADMGRAYFALGDFGRAKIEFETVLTFQNLPLDLRAQVEQYVRAAEARAQSKRTVGTGYIEIGYGRDSNIGSSTDMASLNLPAFGLYVPVPPLGLKTSDNFATLAFGGELNHQLTEQWSLFAGADVNGRAHQTFSDPNSGALTLRGGVAYAGSGWLLRGGLVAGQNWFGNDRQRESVGVNAAWNMILSDANQASAGLSVVRTGYVQAGQSKQDTVATVLNGGWLHSFSDGTAVVSLSAILGYENAVGGRDDGDRYFAGPRLLLQKTFNDSWSGFVTAGITRSRYAAVNPLYLFAREEDLADLAVGLNWTLAKGLILRPQIVAVRNTSNAELYSYDKLELSVNLRYDF